MTPRPVSRLRYVTDSITGAPVNTGRERAECILDEDGHTTHWRLWMAGPDGSWRPEEWRPPTSWMLKKRAAPPDAGSRGAAS